MNKLLNDKQSKIDSSIYNYNNDLNNYKYESNEAITSLKNQFDREFSDFKINTNLKVDGFKSELNDLNNSFNNKLEHFRIE